MIIRSHSAGILDNFRDATVLDDSQPWPIARFLELLDRKLGGRLKAQIFSGEDLREDIGLLLNGRSVRILPEGLNTALGDGDTLFFCVVITGG
jgi:hypothetical protein